VLGRHRAEDRVAGTHAEARGLAANVRDQPAPGLAVGLRLARGARREDVRHHLVGGDRGNRESDISRRRLAIIESRKVDRVARLVGDEIGVRGEAAQCPDHVRRGRGRQQGRLPAHDGGEQRHREAVAVGAEVEHMDSLRKRSRRVEDIVQELARGDRLAAPIGGERLRIGVRDQRERLRGGRGTRQR
jgi:hypothetical protein